MLGILTLHSVFVVLAVFKVNCQNSRQWKKAEITLPLSNSTDDGNTFQLQYLYNTEFKNSSGPLILHLVFGNVEKVIKQHRFLFDLAKHFGATLVAVQHRSEDIDAKYLTPNYVFNDVFALLEKWKNDQNTDVSIGNETDIVLSGSGYAGLVALWLYQSQNVDNKFKAAIVADAPQRLFKGSGLPLGALDSKLTAIYENAGCPTDKVRKAFAKMTASNASEFDMLRIALRLVETSDDNRPWAKALKELHYYVKKAFIGLAADELDHAQGRGKTNYEARVVEKLCADLNNAYANESTTVPDLHPIGSVLDEYYNVGADQLHCFHEQCPYAAEHKTWLKLTCTNFLPYACSQGADNDFLNRECTTEMDWLDSWKKLCLYYTSNNKDIQPEYVQDTFGFAVDELRNLVFVYGDDDVYSIAQPESNKIPILVVPNEGRSAYLEQPNQCDSNSLKQLRFQLINLVACFLDLDSDIPCARMPYKLPPYEKANTTDCSEQIFLYPWDQRYEDGPHDSATNLQLNILLILSTFALSSVLIE